MKKPPANTTTLINPTIITDSVSNEHKLMKISDIMTNPGARYAIPGPFVTSFKNLRKLYNGLMYSQPLDDEHRVYLHANDHVTLTVRKVNYLGSTRVEEIKYRTSYSTITDEFAVPIKRGISDSLYKRLVTFTNRLTGERFVQKLICLKEEQKIKGEMQISSLIEAQSSADPTTMMPRRMIVEGAFGVMTTALQTTAMTSNQFFEPLKCIFTNIMFTGFVFYVIGTGISRIFTLGQPKISEIVD